MADKAFVYNPEAPPYTSFFGIVGVTAAMSFCGKCADQLIFFSDSNRVMFMMLRSLQSQLRFVSFLQLRASRLYLKSCSQSCGYVLQTI